MKRGLRFQTRLTLAMIMAIAVVTFAILAVTEKKVKQTYEQQFARYFEGQVTKIEESSAERSQEFIEFCNRLAETELVRKTLTGEPTTQDTMEFWKMYLGTLREIDGKESDRADGKGKRPVVPGDILNKIGTIAVMNLDGEVTALNHPQQREGRKGPKRQIQMRRNISTNDLQQFAQSDMQQTLFLPFVAGDGDTFVQEMVSTPVIDPVDGNAVGLFLRATPAETEEQRLLERYYQEFNTDAAPRGGIFLEDRVYSRTLDPELIDPLSDAVAAEIETGGDPTAAKSFGTEIAGSPYQVYIAPLHSNSVLNRAYQVTAFPMNRLQEAIAELRIQGSGIGLFGLIVGFFVASFFSKRLSVPLRELSHGTEEVQKGNLDHRVEVKSRDEIGELASSFNEMAEELKQKAVYRELLGKVSDETVAQAMITGSLDLELGGEVKDVSILFCDIRGFTAMTENMPPTAVIDMLNDHMTAMTGIVRKHYGVVDKFVGDEIMAVFGGLKSYDNDAANAAACAFEMIAERHKLNEETSHPIEIGIGIATGEVVAGCMGSVDRLNYTVLGARVNLAARLCGQASAMEAIADDATVEAVGESVESESIPNLVLKGISRGVTAYRISSPVSPVPSNRTKSAV